MTETKKTVREIALGALAWALITIAFQMVVQARYRPERPDEVLSWTATETMASSEEDQPKLLEPFMNFAVSWDSEFYLSIATAGYDDPEVRCISVDGRVISLNYAFMPFYPMAIRAFMQPFTLFMSPLAAATLAGVIVSALGAIAAAVALYFLLRGNFGEEAARKASFLFLIFPGSFFMVQVYTEGLFMGLAFSCLALIGARKWVAAGLLAAMAVFTRGTGIALIVPLLWPLKDVLFGKGEKAVPPKEAAMRFAAAFLPLLAFAVWKFSALGANFSLVEDRFFHRHALAILPSLDAWLAAFGSIPFGRPETGVYYGIELASLLLAVAGCVYTMRRMPAVSLFGLAAIFIPLTSDMTMGLVRYVVAVPPLFAMLGALAATRPVFDKAWTTGCILLFGMEASLFTFGFWVA